VSITTVTTVEVQVMCDEPGCHEHVETSTEAGLAKILRGMGWWVGPEDPPVVFCPGHVKLLQAAGKLGPRSQS
jgi:hypothetical protein